MQFVRELEQSTLLFCISAKCQAIHKHGTLRQQVIMNSANMFLNKYFSPQEVSESVDIWEDFFWAVYNT